MVSIHLVEVSKLFGAIRALDRVTVDVARGELFFLLGPSGCGKTTCLRIIAGFCDPDEGQVHFDERPMAGVPPHQRNTGMVFQNYALWPHLSVYDNVAYGLNLRRVAAGEKRERVQEALRVVRMEAHAERFPNQLSGGQQQRIALARALVIRPDVLLLDEPLSNLDAKLRLEMRREIRRIHREVGVTAVYVTHDQTEALSMADRIAIMNAGHIEQIGTPREVYTSPANAFVAGFIGETNFLEGEVAEVTDGAPVVLTGVGLIRASAGPAGLKVGEGVLCSVRPESVDVLDGNAVVAAGLNCLRAKVQSSMYLGGTEEFELAADAGDDQILIKAVMQNPGEYGREVGDQVTVVIDPRHVVVLRR